MKFTISDEAVNWFIDELDLKIGDAVKFYGKVYGPHGGFSMGIDIQDSDKVFASEEKMGIKFYIEEHDAWFFDNADLEISFDKTMNEPKYNLINR